MKEKRIYIIKDFKNKSLEKQLTWADDELSMKVSYLFNKDTLACKQGEIYNCIFIDRLTHEEHHIKAVVMSSSGEYEPNVVVCPLIDNENKEIAVQGFAIGQITSLNDGVTYFARVSSLKTVDKNAFRLNPNMRLKDVKPVGVINTPHFIAILNGYKKYMQGVIDRNTEYSFVDSNFYLERYC